MMGPPQLSATARTVAITSVSRLAEMIGEVRGAAEAAGRAEPLDFLCSYHDPSLARPDQEPDRHREGFAELEKAGVTSVLVSSRTRTAGETLDFVRAFGATYLS